MKDLNDSYSEIVFLRLIIVRVSPNSLVSPLNPSGTSDGNLVPNADPSLFFEGIGVLSLICVATSCDNFFTSLDRYKYKGYIVGINARPIAHRFATRFRNNHSIRIPFGLSIQFGSSLKYKNIPKYIDNARIIITLPEDGIYKLLANSYEAGESGEYQLKIEAISPRIRPFFERERINYYR